MRFDIQKMILTQCAVCATELGLSLGKKCGRCSTRYCGAACQVRHWKEGGHDKLCSADGALREDHLLYGQIARGQPYGQAPAVTRRPLGLLVSYRPLALLPINFLKLDEVKSEERVRLW